ncbi:MAG: hypothetical protein CTY30_06245, partial [Methylocystis sp.]
CDGQRRQRRSAAEPVAAACRTAPRDDGRRRFRQDRRRKRNRLERFPITWNHLIDKAPLEIKMVEQVRIEKVCQLFWNLL